MIKFVGAVCVTIACFLDLSSYYRQISKTLRTKKSAQISSTAYIMKCAKILFNMTGLAIFANWVGFGMEGAALIFCLAAFGIIVKYKPRGWKLHS